MTNGVTANGTDKIEVERAGTTLYITPAYLATYLGSVGLLRPVLTKNANYTVTTADSLSFILVTAADKVMTLPSTAAGLVYTFVLTNAGLSVSTGLALSPAAADKIMGNGITSLDNKDLILTGATDREGDSVTIVGDGVDGWYITSVTGIWAREA